MTQVQESAEAGRLTSRPGFQVDERQARPVIYWAWAGVAFLAVMAYSWTSWLVQGHAKPTPQGVSDPPTWMVYSIRLWEVGFSLAALVVLYIFIWRPWRRERRLTLDGMFIIAWVIAWAVQDPWCNYTVQWFNYNSTFVNLGCPQCHAPGWVNPTGDRMTEPIVFTPTLYITTMLPGMLIICAVMKRSKRRWPAMGKFGLVMIGIGSMMIADILTEFAWMRTGTYTYGGSIRWATFFHGEYYQFPMVQAFMWGATWGGIACTRYFKNDKGQTLMERGIERVRVSERKKTGIRLLAVTGMVNVIYLFFFNIPANLIGVHADTFPKEIQEKSYFNNTMCGVGSEYACPGPRVPMPGGKDSAHLTPTGEWEAPAGVPVLER